MPKFSKMGATTFWKESGDGEGGSVTMGQDASVVKNSWANFGFVLCNVKMAYWVSKLK